MSDWYVLYCSTRTEAKVAENLVEQGFSAYCPQFIKEYKDRHAREIREKRLSLFPRYLFVEQFDDDRLWFALHKTQGIHAIIMINRSPALVANGVIDELKQASDGGSFDQRFMRRAELRQGQTVAITDGLFRGQLAIVQKVMSSDTVKVLMQLFGTKRCARVPLETLKLVAA